MAHWSQSMTKGRLMAPVSAEGATAPLGRGHPHRWRYPRRRTNTGGTTMQVSVDAPTRVIGREHRANPDGTRVHLRQCPLCECMCGLEVHLDADDKVKLIRPDRDDVWSQGYICPKGTTLGKLHEDPDRIRTPMIREGETWREATWE